MKLADKKISALKEELTKFGQDYIDGCFQKTCVYIQKEIDSNAAGIWCELKECIHKLLSDTEAAQREHKKGDIQYLLFSQLKCSTYLGKLQYQVDAMDDGFYLDRNDVTMYYEPAFLQKRYAEDLAYLSENAKESFIRVQPYVVREIQKDLTGLYHAVVFRMLQSVAEMIMEEIGESNIGITDQFMILYGEYMGKAVILYERRQVSE